jgi:quaternary ammonium compound-resistance protein SugE
MAWTYLLIAAAFEIAFATSMKASEGFTRLWPSLVTIAGIIGGFYFLSLALRDLPVGVGYTVWVGIGALGTVVLGMIIYGETMTVARAASMLAILAGVVGLKLSTGAA